MAVVTPKYPDWYIKASEAMYEQMFTKYTTALDFKVAVELLRPLTQIFIYHRRNLKLAGRISKHKGDRLEKSLRAGKGI